MVVITVGSNSINCVFHEVCNYGDNGSSDGCGGNSCSGAVKNFGNCSNGMTIIVVES